MKKITRNNFLISTVIVFIFGFAMFMTSCEGPAGTAGKDGSNGKDGTAVCTACHGNSDVELKFAQYDLSKHGTGTIYEEEAGRVGCGGCHTGDGFAEAATIGKDDPITHSTSKINCYACHDIHDQFDTTDFSLRIKAGFALRFKGSAADGNVDFKTGNTCGKCHQARSFTRTTPDTVKPASTGATYSRLGPHYGVVANVFAMKGLYDISGQTTPVPTTNPHASLADGCVACHMGRDTINPASGGHTFRMTYASLANLEQSAISKCTACHDVNTIKNAPKAKQAAKDLATYRQKLIDKGMLDTTQSVGSDGTYNILGEYPATPGGKNKIYASKDDVNVLMNYLFIAKDRSLGIHNPAYVQAIIKNGLEYLNR